MTLIFNKDLANGRGPTTLSSTCPWRHIDLNNRMNQLPLSDALDYHDRLLMLPRNCSLCDAPLPSPCALMTSTTFEHPYHDRSPCCLETVPCVTLPCHHHVCPDCLSHI